MDRSAGADIIAVVQEKGGVGKTTTVINLGAWYARLGRRTLLIDLDPQGNLAKGLGLTVPGGAMYRIFRDPAFPLEQAILPTEIPNLDLAGADNGLEAAEIELIHALSRESVLRRKIEASAVTRRYDRILLDCRPSLGVLTVNGMVAADRLLIPVETQYFALEALQTLLDVVKTVQETLQPQLRIAGIVPTKHEARVRVCQVTLSLLRERYPEHLTSTVIRKFVAFPEAQLRGVPTYSVAPGSDAAAAYRALALELDGTPAGGPAPEKRPANGTARRRETAPPAPGNGRATGSRVVQMTQPSLPLEHAAQLTPSRAGRGAREGAHRKAERDRRR
ncbi:MAG TPA: AAA family ATPase [Chloroflexota bacterium]|nr:AAA family ATPase [Chloroflexota bacterium]